MRESLGATPESGHRAGYDGGKRKKGSKVHMVVDTLGELLTLQVTAANVQDRELVAEMAEKLQEVTDEHVELLFADQGYSGKKAADAAATPRGLPGIQLEVVKLPKSRNGFVLLPRRWVVERSFGWMSRFRRLARDYERLATTLAGYHFLAFAISMVHRFIELLNQSH